MCFSLFKKKKNQSNIALWQPESQMPELYENNNSAVQTDITEENDDSFSLQISYKSEEKDPLRINDPTEEQITEAIQSLKKPEIDFICLYGSAKKLKIGDISCSLDSSDNTFNVTFEHYEQTKRGIICDLDFYSLTEAQTLRVMKDYMGERLPIEEDSKKTWALLAQLIKNY